MVRLPELSTAMRKPATLASDMKVTNTDLIYGYYHAYLTFAPFW